MKIMNKIFLASLAAITIEIGSQLNNTYVFNTPTYASVTKKNFLKQAHHKLKKTNAAQKRASRKQNATSSVAFGSIDFSNPELPSQTVILYPAVTTNTISVPAGYGKLIKTLLPERYAQSGFILSQQTDQAIKNLAAKQASQNTFQASEQDLAEKVTPTNLTAAQKQQITVYVAQLINSIRQSAGTSAIKPSLGAIQFADNVASAYNNDKWLFSKHNFEHDSLAINNIAIHYGMAYQSDLNRQKPSSKYQDYEDISQGYLPASPNISMAALKKGIYQTIMDMMFNDGGSTSNGIFNPGESWGHALDLMGYALSAGATQYLGVSIDHLDQIHLIMIDSDDVQPSSTLPKLTDTLSE